MTVQSVIGLKCTGVVLDIRIRLALFWEGEETSETGYVPKGSRAFAKQSVQATCITGWYTRWVYVDLVPPPTYKGQARFSGWSKASRYVKC